VVLEELAAYAPAELQSDVYGTGEALGAFENRIAAALGKEAAAFMPSGTMAQQIALRIWSERTGRGTIAFHPTCHLEIHEARAYSLLHGLRALTCGAPANLMTVSDFEAIADPLAALLIELPQREIGGRLPAWEDLEALCAAARARGTKLHLDGARLWEAAPHYGRSHAEIAALFDSAYVSFYKGLGAIAGAVLAADAATVAQARVWQHRHGGRLVALYPLLLSAQLGFERNVPKMAAYRARAIEIAAALAEIPGIDVVPEPPQTNMFHVFLRGERDELEARAHAYARDSGTFVFARLAATVQPDVWKWEFVVGDATSEFAVEEIARTVRAIAAGEGESGSGALKAVL
jgi:threonine aldolase